MVPMLPAGRVSIMNPSLFQIAAVAIFALALLHVFLAARIEKMSKRFPTHSGTFHLLGEVEIVFGIWAIVLFLVHMALNGSSEAISDLEALNFREPLFVAVTMIVAGSSPVLQAASALVKTIVRLLPLPDSISFAFVSLAMAPLLGSLITEPAAMTIGALLLRDRLMVPGSSPQLRYAALAVLFVNVSVGGVLTNFAAPPVLMVAGRWGWDSWFMATTFGVRAIVTILVNTIVFLVLFRKQLPKLIPVHSNHGQKAPVPLILTHLFLLGLIVLSSHHTVLFMGLFLLFLGIVHAYHKNHSRLLLREGLLVGFFLAGLVVLGTPQDWWLSPLVNNLSNYALFLGTAALTAIIDNAALTYLGSILPDTSSAFKYFLLAGAVAGGGLTVIANAPNPAGASILRDRLPGGALENGRLLLYALPPTIVALVCFAV